jgi:hypothetical protein
MSEAAAEAVVAFDFDGVVCDSANENGQTAARILSSLPNYLARFGEVKHIDKFVLVRSTCLDK